jgi:thiamine phosphate synthase YjbQ (UPF0047 family)
VIATRSVHCQTAGHNDVIDLTSAVTAEVRATGIRDGLVTVFLAGSTAALTTVEYEPGLVEDLKESFDPSGAAGTDLAAQPHRGRREPPPPPPRIAPRALADHSLEARRLTLGVWQQIVLVDFAVRPRARELVVQVAGE